MKPIDLRTKAPSVLHTQYCIIGSGVAGIVLAASLVNKGKRVILLDAGGVGFDASAQDGARADHVSYPYADPLQSRLRQLGGASNHWSNNTSPLDEIDFEKRPWIKDSGWPINRAELTPYYRDAALWCQTGGDGYEAEHWKERGLKAPESFSNDRVLVNIAKASVPATAFFKVHGSRLSQHPELSWFTYADVVDIDFDIVHNIVRQATTSTGHRISAEKFILATGGLENARLLKIFNIKYNGKLGDQNDAVGRYFMDHPTLNGAHLFTPDPSVLHSMQGKMFDTRLVVPFFSYRRMSFRQ